MKEQPKNKQEKKERLKRILNNRWTKLVFSLAIIGSSVPDIITEIESPTGSWSHWGILLIGLSSFVENLLWIGGVWSD